MISFLFILLICIPMAVSAQNLTVIDSSDKMPLAGATLITANGTIAGLSDSRGMFQCRPQDLPLTVRCVGYEEQCFNMVPDTVFLSPKKFELSEVVVVPEDRPILKLRCYIREYTTAATGADTIQMFGEYAADYFLNETKVKGFGKTNTPYIRAKRLRTRYRNSQGLDSIARPSDNDELLSWISICTVNPLQQTVPDSVLNGATAVEQGKYGTFSTTRMAADRLVKSSDILANHKDHHWSPLFLKIIGFTIDASEMLHKSIFLVDENGKYGPNTLQMSTYTIEMTIKSKFIKRALRTKEPVKTYSVVEIYPLEARYLTVKQAKDLERDYSDRKIISSPSAPALPANIKEMLDYPL